MGNLAFVLDILCRIFEDYRIHVEFKGDLPKLVFRVTLLIEKSQIG